MYIPEEAPQPLVVGCFRDSWTGCGCSGSQPLIHRSRPDCYYYGVLLRGDYYKLGLLRQPTHFSGFENTNISHPLLTLRACGFSNSRCAEHYQRGISNSPAGSFLV